MATNLLVQNPRIAYPDSGIAGHRKPDYSTRGQRYIFEVSFGLDEIRSNCEMPDCVRKGAQGLAENVLRNYAEKIRGSSYEDGNRLALLIGDDGSDILDISNAILDEINLALIFKTGNRPLKHLTVSLTAKRLRKNGYEDMFTIKEPVRETQKAKYIREKPQTYLLENALDLVDHRKILIESPSGIGKPREGEAPLDYFSTKELPEISDEDLRNLMPVLKSMENLAA